MRPVCKYPVVLLCLTVLYYMGSMLGLFLEMEYGGVTPIWPPSGIAVAVFWVLGKRYWPMIILGEFFIALSLQQAPVAGFIGGIAQLLEAMLAVCFLRLKGLKGITISPGSVLWFSFLGALLPPLVSSAIGASMLRMLGYLGSGEYVSGFLTWWLGDAIGILVLAPILSGLKSLSFRSRASFFYCLGFIVCLALICLSMIRFGNENSYYLFFILIPFVVVAAINFRLAGAGSATLLLALIVYGMRPQDLIGGDFIMSIRMAFVGTCAFTGYLVTGFMSSRQHRMEIIRRQNSYLTTLHELILGLVSHLQIDQLLDAIVTHACTLVNTANGYFFQKDEASNQLVLKVGKGGAAEVIGYRTNPGDGVAGKVWTGGGAMMVNAYQEWKGRNPDAVWDPVRSIIGVPIKVDSDVVGVLGVAHTEKNRRFTDDDLKVIQKFGELASVAWKNALLYTELSNQLEARKRAEEHLRQFQTAIDFAGDDVLITDERGTILYCNPAFERTTGYCKTEVLGKTPGILKSGLQGEEFYADLWHTITGGKAWTGRFYNKCKGGNIILQDASVAPIRDGEGTIVGFVSVRRDITEYEQMKNQLVQAQKMEAIGTLAGGIAHDFNNILAGIIGYAELALTYHLPADHPAAPNVKEVLHAGKRASELVKQILTFSRPTEVEMKPIDVKPVAKEVIKLITASLPPTIRISTDMSVQNSFVLASPTFIYQILMNLVTNATQSLPNEKGKIEIRFSETMIENLQQNSDPLKPGDYLEIEVSDTGCGMNQETIDKIFEPYFSTKAPGKGTGLGMSVVHGLVSQLKGAISVESEIARGTTVRVLLPLDAAPNSRESSDEASIPGGNEPILFVDDNPQLTDIATQFLGKLGYQVAAFKNSSDAIAYFRSNPDAFRLIVTDMLMPEMTGVEFCRIVGSIRPEIPLIICTGNPNNIRKEDLSGLNVCGIAKKPLKLGEFAAMVRELLDR